MNTSPWLIRNNIYSRSPEPFLQALTNPTLRATKLKYPYEVQYSGYKFADADSAFFGLREALPEEMNLELLADINAAKFMQNPKLMDALVKRSNGDVESYLNTLVHRTGKGSPKWEGEGLQSRAIQALNIGYSRASQGQLAMESQVRDLISRGYDPMQSKSLLRYSSQLRLPLDRMITPLGVQRPIVLNSQPTMSLIEADFWKQMAQFNPDLNATFAPRVNASGQPVPNWTPPSQSILNTQPNPMNRQSFTPEALRRMASDVLEPRGEVLPQVGSDLGQQLAMQETVKVRQALESLAELANKYDIPY